LKSNLTFITKLVNLMYSRPISTNLFLFFRVRDFMKTNILE